MLKNEALLCDIWVAQDIVESGYLKIYDHDVAIKGNEKNAMWLLKPHSNKYIQGL